MQRIVLTNARLLDGDKPAREKATIVIKGRPPRARRHRSMVGWQFDRPSL